MRRKLLAVFSNLLILLGILFPAIDALADSTTGPWTVSVSAPVYNIAANTTTFTYTMAKAAAGPDMSHFDLGVCSSASVKSVSPAYEVIGNDPTVGGAFVIKWDGSHSTVTVTYNGLLKVGSQTWYVKAGNGFVSGSVNGASCETVNADFSVTKKVSKTNDPNTAGSNITFAGTGGTAYYFYTITNTGNVPLTITASDDKLGGLTFAPNPVPAGGTATATASKNFGVPAADETETNTVTANGSYYTLTVGPRSAEAVVYNQAPPPPPPTLSMTLSKKVNSTNDEATAGSNITFNGTGGTAYYFYAITNTGNVPLTITASDDKLGALTFAPNPVPVGGTATATATKLFTAPAASESETNIVTATGTNGALTTGPMTAQATVTNNAALNPSFTLTKHVSTSTVNGGLTSLGLTDGGTVYYHYTVTNNGNVPLLFWSAVDNILGNVTFAFDDPTLSPGESWTGRLQKTFAAGDPGETNVVTVKLTTSGESGIVTRTAEATVTNQTTPPPPPPTLSMTISKKVNSVDDAATAGPSITFGGTGGTAYYFYSITNTGTVPLTITANDDKLGALAFAPNPVPVGGTATATATKTFTAPAANESETNIVTATGTNGALTTGPMTAQATVINNAAPPPPPPSLSMTISKKVNSVNDAATAGPSITFGGTGGTAYYFYSITNTGEVPLTITASDDKLGALTFAPNPIPVGGTATATATKEFAVPTENEEEVNILTATGSYESLSVGPFKAQATVYNRAPEVAPNPNFTLTKHVSTNNVNGGLSTLSLTNGGTVYYHYTITNTGNVSLTLTSASDDKLGAITFNTGGDSALLPGRSWTGSLSKTFAASPSTLETNIATVVMASPGEVPLERTATATVQNTFVPTPPPPPQIATFSLTKTVNTVSNPQTAGSSVTLNGGGNAYYFYTITNHGDVTLNLTSAVDDKLGALTFTPTTLVPGASATATAQKSFAVLSPTGSSQTETNVVTVTMNSFLGTVTRTAQASVVNNPPAPSPDFVITKTAGTSENPASATASLSLNGPATVWYFYTITNTGNIPLSVQSAVDDKLGPLQFTPATIPVGGTARATATKAFAAGESETNIVTVTTTDGTTVIGPRTASVTVTNTAEPRGSVTVRVLDVSPRNLGQEIPISGARVLFGGLERITQADGTISFTNLTFGTYAATADSTDPQNPNDFTSLQSGVGETTITPANPDDEIVIRLQWQPPLAGLGGLAIDICEALAQSGGEIRVAGPVAVQRLNASDAVNGRLTLDLSAGTYSITLNASGIEPAAREVTVVAGDVVTLDLTADCPPLATIQGSTDTGSIKGRICSPGAPGAVLTAVGPGGLSFSTEIKSDGILGRWKEYLFTNLVPGSWTVTLTEPKAGPVSQTLTVQSGIEVPAQDFSLACTGESGPNLYLWGGLMVLAGLLLRLRRRGQVA